MVTVAAFGTPVVDSLAASASAPCRWVFWRGEGCTDCLPGYYGASCQQQCPGGPCNTCGQHGVCSDGFTGTGRCTCFSDRVNGYWTGLGCDRCQSGYFGLGCQRQCPGYPDVCAGRGVCSDGALGNGTCTCLSNSLTGYWSSRSNCTDCVAEYYGTDCSLRCPEGPNCLRCDRGINGS
eukprot:RCo021216